MTVTDGPEISFFEQRRDRVVEFLVAPVLRPVARIEPLHPIGGGEGTFRDDLGVLVTNEVSDSGYIHPCPAWCLLVLSYIVWSFLHAKSGLGGGV
jgi:hypothetical protein